MNHQLSDFHKLDTVFCTLLATAGHIATAVHETMEEEAEWPLPMKIRMIETLVKTLEKLTDLAPFVTMKQQYEGADQIIAWLTQSQEYIGEERTKHLEMLDAFKQDLLRQSGQLSISLQMGLL